jgi:DNA polymerase elongation subunit (family B)
MNLGTYTSVEAIGNSIYYRGRKPGGEEVRLKLKYCPTLFTKSQKTLDSKYKTVHGEVVHPIHFDGMREARDFCKQYENVDSFELYGMTAFQYCFISDMFQQAIKFNINDFVVASIDIETRYENGFPDPAVADQEMLAITYRVKDKIYAFGMKDYKPKNPLTTYYQFEDEISMLTAFVAFWKQNCPDIVTGWNVRFFDITYIINRLVRMLGESAAKSLSPWNMINSRDIVLMGKERRVYEIVGISILDYMELFRKFDVKGQAQESYKLDAIAKYVLKRGKVAFKGSLQDLYDNDFQTYMEYNEEDVNLVHDMNEKGRLIELALTLAYNAKCNVNDIFYQTKMWDTLIFNHLRQKNIVVPFKEHVEKEPFEGAYVKDPICGMHKWVASYDLTSLYPHLIMNYNISPETLLDPEKLPIELRAIASSITVEHLLDKSVDTSALKKHNVTVTPNGMFFRRDIRGFFPELMAIMFKQRKTAKDQMISYQKQKEVETDLVRKRELEYDISSLDNLQLSLKICLNSAYGALGTQGFRWYDARLALGTTSGGQLSIRWVGNDLNGLLGSICGPRDYVIASDTDSVYLNLGPLVEAAFKGDKTDIIAVINWMDLACKKQISPFINQSFAKLADYVNAYEQKMEMKREALASKGVWTGKKHYILDVYDSEGVRYAEPKIKITGLDGVRSAVPAVCRETLKEIYKLVLRSDEKAVQAVIEDFRKKYDTLPIRDIASPRGVKNIDKFSKMEKSIPIHVKGSLTYNDTIVKKGLQKKLNFIKEGEKIRFIYLKTPNVFQSHVMAFPDDPPEEFDLGRYVDYNLQFEKTFLKPARNVLDPIGWTTEHTNTLEDFFQ